MKATDTEKLNNRSSLLIGLMLVSMVYSCQGDFEDDSMAELKNTLIAFMGTGQDNGIHAVSDKVV